MEKLNENQGKLSWLNNGEPFELRKLPVGGREALLKYRSENDEPTEEERKKNPDKLNLYWLGLQRIVVAWTIKRCFRKMDLAEIYSNIDYETEEEELREMALSIITLNFPKTESITKIPKTEEEKK